jgi:ABC-type multidrug transport system ATPase subunit
MMGELSGLPSEAALERAHETLQYVGLGEARYRTLEAFSLGMKQMAKLAQAIVHAPKISFLDEPDQRPRSAGAREDDPARQGDPGLGQAQIILSSHLLRDVEECCDEVLVLKDGKIAFHGNLEKSAAHNEVPAGRNARRRAGRSRRRPRRSAARARCSRRAVSRWSCPSPSRCAISTGSPASSSFRSGGSTTSAIRSRTSSSRPMEDPRGRV